MRAYTVSQSLETKTWNKRTDGKIIRLGGVFSSFLSAQVRSEGVAVSHLKSGGFVGSMAFSRLIKKPPPTAGVADEGYVYKDGGMFRKGWEAFQDLLRKEGSVVGEVAKSVVGDKKRKRLDTAGLERSTTTVTATSDVSWVWAQETREGSLMLVNGVRGD